MSSTMTAICVWYDEVGDPGRPKWIVSLDELGVDGYAETTETLAMADLEDDAMAAAKRAALRRGLPLYRYPANSPAELVGYMVEAQWLTEERRYVVDPTYCPCDCGTGWLSDDGDCWWQNDDAAGEPQGDFSDATIRFVGGPRDGEEVE